MAKIIGIEYVDYVSKKTNKQVSGYRVHMTAPIGPANGEGEFCDSAFFNSVAAQSFFSAYPVLEDLIGKEARVIYNRFGRPEELMLL